MNTLIDLNRRAITFLGRNIVQINHFKIRRYASLLNIRCNYIEIFSIQEICSHIMIKYYKTYTYFVKSYQYMLPLNKPNYSASWNSLEYIEQISDLVSLYSAHWVTRKTLQIMLFVRPTRGQGGCHTVNNAIRTCHQSARWALLG